jgi:hypothetical protein
MIDIRRSDLPSWLLRLIEDVCHQHATATPQPDNSAFVVATHGGRRFAVCEYGRGFYDEGVPVWLVVDLTTGVNMRITDYQVRVHGYGVITALAEPDRIPDSDPIRQWLAADPGDAAVMVELHSDDELERFSAVEIVRTDRPELLPVGRPTSVGYPRLVRRGFSYHVDEDTPPQLLPYEVLFGRNAVPIQSIGSGRGRITQWPNPQDTVQGRARAAASAAKEDARRAARITLILTTEDGGSLRHTEGHGELILPQPVTFVRVRTDKEPGLRFALYRNRAITAKPFYEAEATPKEQPIEGGDGTVTVTVWPLRR